MGVKYYMDINYRNKVGWATFAGSGYEPMRSAHTHYFHEKSGISWSLAQLLSSQEFKWVPCFYLVKDTISDFQCHYSLARSALTLSLSHSSNRTLQSDSLFSCAPASFRKVWVYSSVWFDLASLARSWFSRTWTGGFHPVLLQYRRHTVMTSDHFVLCRGSCAFQENEMWV